MGNLKVKQLKVTKYRNVSPCKLNFSDGINVLLGQNGTGKTTLLKLIEIVSTSNFTTLQDEEFNIEYTLTHPQVEAKIKFQNKPSDYKSGTPSKKNQFATLTDQDSEASWSYSIGLKIFGSPTVNIKFSDSSKGPGKLISSPKGSIKTNTTRNTNMHGYSPFKERAFSRLILLAFQEWDTTLSLDSYSEFINEAYRYTIGRLDEGLDSFTTLTSQSNTIDTYEKKIPEVTIINTGKGGRFFYGHHVPNDLQSLVLEKSKTAGSIISIANREMEFLETCTKAMNYKHGEFIIELKNKEVFDKTSHWHYGKFKFKFTLDDGSVISHDDLSYGQKRLLTFFYYSAASENIVIADELVNGLHYDWIGTCVKLLEGKQAFLTSQNPLLLDFLSFETAKEVESTFILCKIRRSRNKNSMAWSNLKTDDAESFYSAYDVGIQQVSEILRTKGLW